MPRMRGRHQAPTLKLVGESARSVRESSPKARDVARTQRHLVNVQGIAKNHLIVFQVLRKTNHVARKQNGPIRRGVRTYVGTNGKTIKAIGVIHGVNVSLAINRAVIQLYGSLLRKKVTGEEHNEAKTVPHIRQIGRAHV